MDDSVGQPSTPFQDLPKDPNHSVCVFLRRLPLSECVVCRMAGVLLRDTVASRWKTMTAETESGSGRAILGVLLIALALFWGVFGSVWCLLVLSFVLGGSTGNDPPSHHDV